MIDAVGMEAHGSPAAAKVAQAAVGLLPDAMAQPLTDKLAIDRLDALHAALKARAPRRHGVAQRGLRRRDRPDADDGDVRPGHPAADGPGHVKRWIDDILPLVLDDADPLGVLDLTTHRLPLEEAPHGYEIFQKKEDGCVKVVLAAVSADPDVRAWWCS